MGAEPRIILHSGLHKTGTTSVQVALRAHAGVLAPLYQVQLNAGPLRIVAEAARLWSAQPRPMAMRVYRRALRTWVQGLDLAPGQGLILSCEDLSGHMPGARGVTRYEAAPRLAAELAHQLRARFPDHALCFVLGTRAPEGWLRSLHWQQAKHHHMVENAEAFAARLREAADFTALLAQIGAATHAPVIGAALERHGARPLGPVEAIYDLADLPADLRAALPPVAAANRAPVADLAEAFVALNRQDMPPEARVAAKAALLAAAATQ